MPALPPFASPRVASVALNAASASASCASDFGGASCAGAGRAFAPLSGVYLSSRRSWPVTGLLIIEPRKAPAAAPTGPATAAPATIPIWPAPRPSTTLSTVSGGRQVSGTHPDHSRAISYLPSNLSRSAR
eukprot:1538069-Prymnesium_polylepis.2